MLGVQCQRARRAPEVPRRAFAQRAQLLVGGGALLTMAGLWALLARRAA